MKITRKELIKKYIDFFKSNNHKEIPNTSLIPINDPTTLFIGSGMETIIPYLLGQKHPLGKRLTNVQKCIRTIDIDEVGDNCHHTFFEMLGNWSLGDYFKEKAIKMSFEFATKILNIDPKKITVTCFKGDKNASKDQEAAKIWKSLGITKIKFLGKQDNWWGPVGKTGPCGPDTELFVNNIEMWNDVFMQYNKTAKGTYEHLKQKNVDNGRGLERVLALVNGYEDNYLTDCWQPIIKQIEKLSKKKYGKHERVTRHMRIIADHLKAATMIMADGIRPSNTEQGYVVRRIIRRAIRYCYVLGIKNSLKNIAEPIFSIYEDYNLDKKKILGELGDEEEKFEKTIEQGLKKAKKILGNKIPLSKEKNDKIRNYNLSIREIMKKLLTKKTKGDPYSFKPANLSEKEISNALITGKEAFLLYQSYGFPEEMILELTVKEKLLFDESGFQKQLEKHQHLSRTSSAGKFKSGLADNSEQTTKLHTATHLLNQALRETLDKNITQKGSNINPERLRFDFNFPRKLTDQEKKKIEDWINNKIKKDLVITQEILSLKQAIKQGAQAEFGAKYPNKVTVYTIKDKSNKTISKEICTGPHCPTTLDLGTFKIIKEESSAAGIRRIKAELLDSSK